MPRVLVVDDNPHIRSMFRNCLERAGYEVDEAIDGDTALECYRTQPADLVMTDIAMPNKDGIEMIMDLWRDYPDVKIIAVSGSPRATDPRAHLEFAAIFGAMRTFRKPVDLNELLDAVRELIGAP